MDRLDYIAFDIAERSGRMYYVSPHFVEDPQRVLRAAAAISMYDLRPSKSLIRHCTSIAHKATDISSEVAGKNLMKIDVEIWKEVSAFYRA